MNSYEVLSLLVPTIVPTLAIIIGFYKDGKKREEQRVLQIHLQKEHGKDIEEIKKTTKETHDQLFKKLNNHGERLSKLEGVVYGKGNN